MIKNRISFLLILALLAGCFNKKDDSVADADNFETAESNPDAFESIDDGTLIPEDVIAENEKTDPFLESAQPFYPTADKFESIEAPA